MTRLANIHPGEVLSAEFLKPSGMTVSRLAANTGIEQNHIEQIIAGTRDITEDTAIRLGSCLSMNPRFWFNLQTMYDLEEEARR